MTAGPEFDFGRVIPAEIHVVSLEQALADLEAHRRACPGSYLECVAAGTLAKREKWITELAIIEARVTLAKAYAGPGTSRTKKRPPMVRQGDNLPRACSGYYRMTPEDYATKVRSLVAKLDTLVPGSPEWRKVRAAASNTHLACRKRALEDRVPVPDMPTIPHLGALVPLSHCRPRLEINTPEQEAKRERWRRQGEAKRERKRKARLQP